MLQRAHPGIIHIEDVAQLKDHRVETIPSFCSHPDHSAASYGYVLPCVFLLPCLWADSYLSFSIFVHGLKAPSFSPWMLVFLYLALSDCL